MAKVVAVTGKGGTGKTTFAALMIKYLRDHDEGPILAIDADPDANLASVLGIPVEETIGDLREEVLRKIKDFPAGMSKQHYLEAGFHRIIVETPKVDFVAMGRSEGPGCYCYINNLLRKFASDLTPSYRWIVMDNEAGMEHLSRRTGADVDALIVLVNQNPLSTDCARRVDELTRELRNDIKKKYYVINASQENGIETVRKRVEDLDMEYLGYLPHDPALEQLIFRGEPIDSLQGGPAITHMNTIMKSIRED